MSFENTTTQSNFLFTIAALPQTQFALTSATLPSIIVGQSNYPSRNHNIPIPGTHVEYDPLTLEFIVEEDFSNYIEVLNWCERCRAGSGQTLQQMFSDGELTILSNNKQPIVSFGFEGLFPNVLGEIQFTTQDEADVQVCNLTLRFTRFVVK